MVRIGILGATGYTALELMKLLIRHPQAELVALTSRQDGEPHVGMVHPQIAGRLDLKLENCAAAAIASRVDCLFSCLPHAASAEALVPVLDGDVRVVDLSADFRLWDAAAYKSWYGEAHPAPNRLGQVVYGLPELFRERIAETQLVANPGCYPTSAILGLAPLVKAQLIDLQDVIIDSKSGVSGAGRTPKLTTHYPECNESISAYNVGRHRHTPEIAQILSHVAGKRVEILFTPHLTPMDRGILSTCYAKLTRPCEEPAVMQVFRDFYDNEPFIRVVDHLPASKDTVGTNFCDVTARIVGNRVVTICCLDNLIKGAAGAAVQNFNLMFGFAETTAL
jgi:N-acetyl-gamma-glutamyl-phosphate reductase